MTLQPQAGRPPLRTPQAQTLVTEKSNGELDLSEAALIAMQAAQEQAKKQQWAQWVGVQYNRCQMARRPFERQWYINLAFISGKQYVAPMETAELGFRLVAPKAPPWRVRIVINKVRIAVRRECAKLTTSKPMPTVIPATNESEDQSAAAVGEALLKSRFGDADFESVYREWIWWGVACGTSYLKQFWNASAKDYDAMSLPQPPLMPGTDQPLPTELLDELAQQDPRLQQMKDYLATPQPAVGKVETTEVSPFQLYVPNVMAKTLEKQPYVMHVTAEPVDKIRQKFNNPKISADSRAVTGTLDAATIITKNRKNEQLDCVLVKEVWIKPGAHPDFPEGGMLTVINDQVMQHTTKWPLPYPEYPFYKYDGIPTGGFYSDSVLVDLIPVQKEYNRTRSQMIEIKNTVGKPKLVYQKGSVDPRKISSEPGASVEYKAGYEKPQVVAGVDVPATFYNEVDLLKQDFDDISAQHAISRGDAPGDITSGTAITFLQEQDDSVLNYQIASIEWACKYLGKHFLTLVSTYWDDSRVVKITGKNNSYESMHWKKGQLDGNTDVRIQTGSALPDSKAARQALITDWMMNGFIDPAMGMEILNFGYFEKAMDDMLVDKRQAIRENLKLADNNATKMYEMLMNPAPGPNGEPPQEMPNEMDPSAPPTKLNGDGTPFQPQPPIPVNTWDNHEEHINWHNHFRKTQEFELLPEANKMAFELHVQAHQMAMQANMLNAQQQIVQQNQPSQAELDAEAEAKVEAEGGLQTGESDTPQA